MFVFMKRYLYIFIFIVAVIIIPLLLNFIIGLHTPNNITIVGKPSDWLLFYGSYFGGALTAIIAFVALFLESKRNKKSIEIAYKQKTVKELELTLADSVSLFDYSRIGTVSLFLEDRSQYNSVLKEMDEYLNKVTTTANAWGVIYSDSTQPEVREFQSAYDACWHKLVEQINRMTELITALRELPDNDDEQRERIMREITTINEFQAEYKQNYLSPLFSRAKNWIAAEKCKLDILEQSL
jgi:hypothetical protein